MAISFLFFFFLFVFCFHFYGPQLYLGSSKGLKGLGKYPAILISCLVNDTYIMEMTVLDLLPLL